ncbi:thioesterase family protein [Nocardia alni]|uniref:thioesterase family protein n=1 Tax=Nocardia alni TaxID=2815723 RepID=UPI001C23E653|nr:thioesterase family protein [Nocardia alni]
MSYTSFNRVDGQYVPTEMAIGPWGHGQLGGTSLCGLLAHELETHRPGDDFTPVRFTVDLFRPVLNEPIELRSEVVRESRRIRVVDAAIVQGGQVRTRATAMYLAQGEQPPGRVWQAARDLPVPTPEQAGPVGGPPLFKPGERDWTHDFASAQNDERLCVWHNLGYLVDFEPMSPFERAAYIADATSMTCNWGTEGIGYINCDVTMTLTRLPAGTEVGLRAVDQVAAQGISVGTATMYDRLGPLGTCVVDGLANAQRQVDLASHAAERMVKVNGR